MKLFISFFSVFFLVSCSEDSVNNNCRFLLDVNVNFPINLSFPQYTPLNFASNSVYIPNEGNSGVIVYFSGTNYFAWDAGDPNHVPSDCSTIEITNGVLGTCACGDGNTYDFLTGQLQGGNNSSCPLKNYRVEKSGNTLLVFN